MSSFFGCLIGTFIGNFLFVYFSHKIVEKKLEKDFEDRWFE